MKRFFLDTGKGKDHDVGFADVLQALKLKVLDADLPGLAVIILIC